MAQKNSDFTHELKSNIKPSNTGHKFDPARKAPLKAKESVYLGSAQTSDGRAAEERNEKGRNGKKTRNLSAKAQKRRALNLKEH